jgi:Fe-S cluster biogenesis protein NfuA
MPSMDELQKNVLKDKVNKALEDIRPHLMVDGGDIELVDITEDLDVQVRWLGNCAFCSMSAMTMRAGIEQAIKSQVPEIQNVLAVNGVHSAVNS